MKELQERADIYAAEKMNELMARAIAQAYIDGYQDGYNKRCAEGGESVYMEDGITVYDMGLPSGTLWSLDYLNDGDGHTCFLSYAKAAKQGLPSIEQVEELIEKCRWLGDYSSSGLTFYRAVCIGATGERISFNSSGYKQDERTVGAPNYGGGSAYFWIQDEEEGDERNAVRIHEVVNGKPKVEIVKIFSGFRLPVMVVRR